MAKKKMIERLRTPAAVKWFWIVLCAPVALIVVLLLLTRMGAFGKLPTFEELEIRRTIWRPKFTPKTGK